MKSKIKKIGNIITLISICYLAMALIRMDINMENIYNKKYIFMLGIIILVQCVVAILSSIPWSILLSFLSNENINYTYSSIIFIKSNVLKYLPGNFFHYVGRNQIVLDYNINHLVVIIATIVDMVFGLCNGLVFSLIFFGNFWRKYIKTSWLILGISILFIISLILPWLAKKQYKIVTQVQEILLKFLSKKGIKILILVFEYYTIQNIITIFIVAMVGYLVLGKIKIINLFLIGCGYIFSSVIGTLTLGAPAGIGIRETVMLFICKDYLYEDVLLLLVIMRIIGIFGDFFSFLIVKLYEMINRMRKIE